MRQDLTLQLGLASDSEQSSCLNPLHAQLSQSVRTAGCLQIAVSILTGLHPPPGCFLHHSLSSRAHPETRPPQGRSHSSHHLSSHSTKGLAATLVTIHLPSVISHAQTHFV